MISSSQINRLVCVESSKFFKNSSQLCLFKLSSLSIFCLYSYNPTLMTMNDPLTDWQKFLVSCIAFQSECILSYTKWPLEMFNTTSTERMSMKNGTDDDPCLPKCSHIPFFKSTFFKHNFLACLLLFSHFFQSRDRDWASSLWPSAKALLYLSTVCV